MLPEGLARLGVKVDVVPVYRAVPPASVPPEAAEVLAAGQVDILTFTSSSTVHNFAGLVGKERFSGTGRPGHRGLHRPHHHARRCRNTASRPRSSRRTFTIPALAAAIVEYFEGKVSGEQ